MHVMQRRRRAETSTSGLSLCLVLGLVCWAAGGGIAAAQAGPGGADNTSGNPSVATPPQLLDVTFAQKLNDQLPLDTPFKDESGQTVKLGKYFGDKPVLLAFVYYTCPMLCTQIENGISSALKVIPFTPGKDFEVVLISFDPRDTPAVAAKKKADHLRYWSAEDTAGGWHWLTGQEADIKKVTAAAGFNYRWDERIQQYAHVSGVLVTTPGGKLSRYFYGVEYSPKELRLALVESGNNQIGSPVDELLLYCYHYDPAAGKYGVVVMNLIRLGGVLTLVMLGGFFVLVRRRDTQPPVEGGV